MTRSLRHQLLDNFGWYTAALFVNSVSRYVCIALLWRSISDPEKQEYALLQVLFGLLLIVADFGLENSIVRFFREDPLFLRIALLLTRRVTIAAVVPLAIASAVLWYLSRGSWNAAAVGIASYGYALFHIGGALFRSSAHVGKFIVFSLVRSLTITGVIAWVYLAHGEVDTFTWFLTYGVVGIALGTVILVWFAGKMDHPADRKPIAVTPYMDYIVPTLLINLILWSGTLITTAFVYYYCPSDLPPFRLMLEYAWPFSMFALLIGRAWPAIYFMFTVRQKQEALQAPPLIAGLIASGVAAALMLGASPVMLQLISGHKMSSRLLPMTALILGTNAIAVLIPVVRPFLEFQRRAVYILAVFCTSIVLTTLLSLAFAPKFGGTGVCAAGLAGTLLAFWGLILGTDRLRSNKRLIFACLGFQALFSSIICALTLFMAYIYV